MIVTLLQLLIGIIVLKNFVIVQWHIHIIANWHNAALQDLDMLLPCCHLPLESYQTLHNQAMSVSNLVDWFTSLLQLWTRLYPAVHTDVVYCVSNSC